MGGRWSGESGVKFIERLGSFYLSDKNELLAAVRLSPMFLRMAQISKRCPPHETYGNSISSRSRDVEFLCICASRRRWTQALRPLKCRVVDFGICDAGEVALCVEEISPKLETVEIGQLPLYNQDLETDPLPAQMDRLPPARQGRRRSTVRQA
jgi:hypothetical protein